MPYTDGAGRQRMERLQLTLQRQIHGADGLPSNPRNFAHRSAWRGQDETSPLPVTFALRQDWEAATAGRHPKQHVNALRLSHREAPDGNRSHRVTIDGNNLARKITQILPRKRWRMRH